MRGVISCLNNVFPNCTFNDFLPVFRFQLEMFFYTNTFRCNPHLLSLITLTYTRAFYHRFQINNFLDQLLFVITTSPSIYQ